MKKMSGDDSNSLTRECNNRGTREATQVGRKANGPEHVKQPKQSVRWMGRMGVGGGHSPRRVGGEILNR